MNVLISSTTFIPSVILCGHCQLDFLQKQGRVNYKFVISHFTDKKNIEWADIIVFLRSDSDIDAYVSKIAKKAGKHLVYVLDDDILNVPEYLSSAPYYLLPSTQNNICTIMSNCDTFLTTSPVLLDKYGKGFNHSFLIDEPSLNTIDTKPKNDKIKIGFAGSIDRSQDLNDILEEAISKLVEKYQDSIEIEVMGAKPAFVEKLGLTHLPYQDGYDAYTAFMVRCNWDIGLAPMPDTEFHRCKYFNKYVEYASFGIAGIYSDLEPYVFGIRDKENGLLVENTTEAWYRAICELIENEQLRSRISENCLLEAKKKYSLDILAEDYLEKITEAYKPVTDKKTIEDLTFVKTVIFFKRVYRKIKEKGKDFPVWLKEKLRKKLNEYRKQKTYQNNTKKLEKMLQEKKSIFVISPYFAEKNDVYHQRVKLLDDALGDVYKIYLSGEDRLCEHLMTDFIDDNHASIIFNSYDIHQTEQVLELIRKSHNCLIHSVIRFMREKISDDMFRVFDLDDVTVIWDSHGMIPEEYEKHANFHTGEVTSEIEKRFYQKADVLICENDALRDHFIDKYGKKDMEYLVYSGSSDPQELRKTLK